MTDKNFHKQVVVEALDIAIKKGCFGLVETTNIVNAVNALQLNIQEPLTIQENERPDNTVE
jgi:hypothetical protein